MKFETHGETEFKGKKYYLEEQAQGPMKIIQSGQTLLVQYEADAVDEDGIYHKVIWRFDSDEIKCHECLSEMDWSGKNIHDVVVYEYEQEE